LITFNKSFLEKIPTIAKLPVLVQLQGQGARQQCTQGTWLLADARSGANLAVGNELVLFSAFLGKISFSRKVDLNPLLSLRRATKMS
jgi:hypothetical protein